MHVHYMEDTRTVSKDGGMVMSIRIHPVHDNTLATYTILFPVVPVVSHSTELVAQQILCTHCHLPCLHVRVPHGRYDRQFA